MENKKKKLGVVVGRFQTPYLHDGHQHLIDTAKADGDDTLIIIGTHEGWASGNDPLDPAIREVMLRALYPDAHIAVLRDQFSDDLWSAKLDQIIEEHFPDHAVTLYGSRDSFIPYYSGKHATEEVEAVGGVSATELRKRAVASIPDSPEFRSGVMYAHTKQNYPTSFQTVDVAILHSTEPKILLGRKNGLAGWIFIGGFVDPTDASLEAAARRESLEEAGDIELADIRYIGSYRVDDHRYRKSVHKILTALIRATYVFGPIKASDDLDEVAWHDLADLIDVLADKHKPLGRMLLDHLAKN